MLDKTKDISGITKPTKKNKCKDITTDKQFRKILDIYFGKNNIKEQVDVFYSPKYGNKQKSNFTIDSLVEIENMKLAFEYDGPYHYDTVFKIERDTRKSLELEKQGFTIIRVPYYLQFTKDIAKYYFEPYQAYSDEKYQKMLTECYEINDESDMLAPGWHGTKALPANWTDRGIEIFLDEVSRFPVSVSHQCVHSLNLYKKATNGQEWLVVPIHNLKFNDFLSLTPEEKYLNYFFSRS
jgi:hypothetical protein